MAEESAKERVYKSISHYIDAAPATEAEVVAYRVSDGKRFILTRVQVAFALEAFFELLVNIRRGLENIKPTTGHYRGEGITIVDTTLVEYGSGEAVKIWYKNIHTTERRRALVLIEGYEE